LGGKVMTRRLRAIIAGAGFGGLTAAAALAQRGWEVVVYERQQEVRASGSGIYVWENGLRVLDAIDADVLGGDTFRGLAIEQRNHLNEVIDDGGLPPDLRLVTIPRKDLLNAIRATAEKSGVTIKTASEVIGATANGELHFSAGKTEVADLAIGADGIWSAVRQALGLELFHEQTFEGALRAIIPGTQADLGDDGQHKYIECWNSDRRFLITPINKSEIYLALTCPKSDEAGRRDPFDHATWSRSFPAWRHLIERVSSVLTWSPYSTIGVKAWSSGRTAIIGDAAHAQPPNLGQGGGTAMQGGLALAAHLEGVSDPRDIPDRLMAWEKKERPLMDHCQKWSRLYGEISFLPNEVRERTIKHGLADPWVREQMSRAARSIPTGSKPPKQTA
jgi:2-polyprenyl-6-methoxyphenol hydroxylase-like FAD-dependent oxidoreductase